MKRSTLVVLLAIGAFIVLLALSTLRAQRAECSVCVEFEGKRNCATASAAAEDEAAESAQRTACGPVASGMDATIACGNRPPASRVCRTR